MGKKGYEINQKFFLEHEEQMNQIVCRFLAYVFFIIPIMLIVHLFGIVLFSKPAIIGLAVIGTICTLSPILLSKNISNQMAIKYYSFFCGIILVCYLVTSYRIGISIAFFLPAIASCIYFNPTFTFTMTTVSYVVYLFSYYIRYVIVYKERYVDTMTLPHIISMIIGFTIEFCICAILLYIITIRSRSLFVDQKLLIGKLQKSEEKMRMAMGAARDILFEYDIENDVYTSNKTIRGWKEKEIEIPDFSKYIEKIKWDTDEFITLFHHIITLPGDAGDHFQEEICINFEENGIKYPAWAGFEINILRNAEGNPITILGKLRDITEEKIEELKRKEEKHVDPLTGMYTYASFRRLIKEMGNQQKELMHQIMVIHIKNYQEIGDCYGGVYRDFVILNASDLIRNAIEDKKVLSCRLSTDVFLLYINDGSKTDGRQLRQELNNGLHELYIGEKEVDTLDFDFGFYSGKEHIEDLLQVALRYINENADVAIEGEKQKIEGIDAVSGEEKLYDLPEYQRGQAVTKFNNNISALILGAKDQQSTIQIILDRIGKFFGLDAIRVYEFPEIKQAVMPAYLWAGDEEIRKECALLPLSKEEQKAFSDNFGHSRIVDNTVVAFRDFFIKYHDNPLISDDYSSLICPLSTIDICQGILIFDMHTPAYRWSEEQKEHLLEVCKIVGNYILVALNNDSTRRQRVFLTTMSRMLRMPMNSIFELTDIARKSMDNPTELIRYMDMIDVSSENMLHVVNNIIDLSKLNIDTMTLNEGIFSLEDMLAEIEERVVKSARAKKISFLLERRFGDNLVRGDRGRLEQVLLTLTESSIRYTAEKGIVHLRVYEVSRESHTVEIAFEIEDNGMGIPKEIMPHVFDMLSEKNVNPTEREFGIEMDLGVCYQLVHVMGSELELESKEKEGTKFTFVLKLGLEPNESMLGFLSQRKWEEAGRIELTDKKILVAEDDRINGEILKRLFEKNGAVVMLANNGKKCLDLFRKSKEGEYAFILMDISMPVMNGHETTKAIRNLQRQDAKKIPILALSANAFQEDIKMSMMSGMNAHLAKPVHMDKIMEELVRVQSAK